MDSMSFFSLNSSSRAYRPWHVSWSCQRILVGYRWLDAKGLEPLWPFGFGLSYTTFKISDINVEGKIGSCGQSKALISAIVTNTGSCDGSEVVQIYIESSTAIKDLGRDYAPRSLAGFSKVLVPKCEKAAVQIELGLEAVSWFDVEGKGGVNSGGKLRVDPD
ncbi:hypothetical protein ACLOAV_008656 [Pseudogymnoascus australis]